jgi:hypothetical protein
VRVSPRLFDCLEPLIAEGFLHYILHALDEVDFPLNVFAPLLEYVQLPVHEVVLIYPVLDGNHGVAVLHLQDVGFHLFFFDDRRKLLRVVRILAGHQIRLESGILDSDALLFEVLLFF